MGWAVMPGLPAQATAMAQVARRSGDGQEGHDARDVTSGLPAKQRQ